MTQRNTMNQPIYSAHTMDEVRQKNNNSALQDRSGRSGSNNRSQTRNKTKIQYQGMQKMKSMLNFESKLEKDLSETTSALVGHMKKHSILSQNNITLMKPIEKLLLGCFDQMKRTQIEESKNYFAMSLKLFF